MYLPVLLIISLLLSGCNAIGPNKSAALQVTTNPQASLFLGDKHLGKTPYFSDQLKEGVYTLKLTASEATYVDKIELKPGALTVVNRDLNANSFAQSGEVLWLTAGSREIFIATSPPEADITIDGKYYGKSPVLVSDLDVSDHTVTAKLSGYLNREFSIKNSNKHKLIANVTLASQIAKNPPQQSTQSQAESIEILTTPQGFLRVRKEPELTAQEIGQVKSGTSYEIIQETDGWVKISFDGKLGWISKQYTKRI